MAALRYPYPLLRGPLLLRQNFKKLGSLLLAILTGIPDIFSKHAQP